jgi:anti-sigma B factor antagonist
MVVEFSVAERRLASGVAVVEVHGEVDVDTVPEVEEAIVHVLEQPAESLVLDFTEVTFLGSTGLTLLLETNAACHDRGIPFRLAADSRAVLRPLQITDLVREFTVVHSVEAAVAVS